MAFPIDKTIKVPAGGPIEWGVRVKCPTDGLLQKLGVSYVGRSFGHHHHHQQQHVWIYTIVYRST